MSEQIRDLWISPTITTPIGELCAAASVHGLIKIWFGKTTDLEKQFLPPIQLFHSSYPLLTDALSQLIDYFTGNRKNFDLPLDLTKLTPFQRSVLGSVQKIPFGEICTYSEIAIRIDHPKAIRAVGLANGHNPIPIIIPCHRIIGKDRKLHGYSMPGGIRTKAWLLAHEGHKIENDRVLLNSKWE